VEYRVREADTPGITNRPLLILLIVQGNIQRKNTKGLGKMIRGNIE